MERASEQPRDGRCRRSYGATRPVPVSTQCGKVSRRVTLEVSEHGCSPEHPPRIKRAAQRDEKVRIGRNLEVRPLGGGLGCLAMILISIVASIFLTFVVNVLR